MSWSEEVKKVYQSCLTLWHLLDCSLPGLLCPWNSPGQNIGMGSHTLLQRIFPSQGLNPGLPHYRHILYHLSHQESPRTQEWVSYPFYSRSFQPRNLTRVSCAAGRFLTSWATRGVNGTYQFWLQLNWARAWVLSQIGHLKENLWHVRRLGVRNLHNNKNNKTSHCLFFNLFFKLDLKCKFHRKGWRFTEVRR